MSGLVAMQMMLIGLLDGVQSIGVVTPYRAQSVSYQRVSGKYCRERNIKIYQF